MAEESNNLLAPEQVQDLIRRARSGDDSAMPDIRKMLDRTPEFRKVLGADLERTVEHFMCKSLAEKDHAFHEAIRRELEMMRAKLLDSNPTPIEEILVDRIVACWLQVQEADLRYSQAGECKPSHVAFLLKRQDHAHKRYLSAIKALATVRKLAIPVLQVNFAENQVNLAGAASCNA